MKTIFEQGAPGHGLSLLPACDVPVVTLAPARKKPLRLPQVSENELIRHYTALSHRVHGMNALRWRRCTLACRCLIWFVRASPPKRRYELLLPIPCVWKGELSERKRSSKTIPPVLFPMRYLTVPR